MNIVSFKEIDKIVPNNDAMIYCTCAEKKQSIYLDRISAWLNRMNFSDVDIFIFNDGKILEENKNLNFGNAIFVEFDDALKRESVHIFPGWKRSFYYALLLSKKYKYFNHVENDCYIVDIDAYRKLLFTNGVVATPFCQKYNFPESAMMIINNIDVKNRLIKHYENEENIYENIDFEVVFKRNVPENIVIGNSTRDGKFQDGFGFICQCKPEIFMG